MKKIIKQFLYIFALALVLGVTSASAATYLDPYYYNQPDYYYDQYYPQYTYPSQLSLSQQSLVLSPGQSSSVYINGGYNHSTSGDNQNIVKYSLFNSVLTVQGLYPGSTILTICSESGCANLYVTVTGSNNYSYPYNYNYDYNYQYQYTDYRDQLLDTKTLRIDKGDRERININIGRNDDVYISRNTNSRIASATIDDDELVVKGLREGSTTITVCEEDGYCSTLRVTVED